MAISLEGSILAIRIISNPYPSNVLLKLDLDIIRLYQWQNKSL
jgi:hypothetical protein